MGDLYEVEKRYTSRLVSQVEQYRGQGLWIHFSHEMKFGIRPTSNHNDPKGIYFYPLDWLLDHDRFNDGKQWATDFPYWTLVRLGTSNIGLTMSKLSIGDKSGHDIMEIAFEQGWEDFPQYVKDEITNAVDSDWQKKFTTPQELFWRYVRKDRKSNSRLKGLSYIYDDGTGTIQKNEPYQLLVLDPRCITKIAAGNQFSGRYVGRDEREKEESRHAYEELLKALRGRYGGDLVYKNDEASLVTKTSNGFFKIERGRGNWARTSGIKISLHWGRASKTISMDEHQFSKSRMSDVVSFFSNAIDHVISLGKRDLFFKPFVSEPDIKKKMKELVSGLVFETEIDNSYAAMDVTGTHNFELNAKTEIRAYVKKDEISWYLNGYLGKENGRFLAIPIDDINVDLTPILRADLLAKTEFRNPTSTSYLKFYHRDDYEAFLGWICVMSGIAALQSNLDWIEKYNQSDKEILMRDIARVYE